MLGWIRIKNWRKIEWNFHSLFYVRITVPQHLHGGAVYIQETPTHSNRTRGKDSIPWLHEYEAAMLINYAWHLEEYAHLSDFCHILQQTTLRERRSQWPRGLRHELSSLARTLRSWVRILLKAWMSTLCAFILCLCCSVCMQRPCNGLIPRSRSPTDCV
jgi:hypothetical protein